MRTIISHPPAVNRQVAYSLVGGFVGRITFMNPRSAAARPLLASSPFATATVATAPVVDFAPEDRITHDRHGLGVVVSLYGDSAMIVDFGECRRQVAIPNSRVTKL